MEKIKFRSIYKYTDEFKATAVALSHLDGVAVKDVAKEPAIHPFKLSRWRKHVFRRFILINITCHCGNVNLTFKQLPTAVRDCDCPICNRLGALWADFEPSEVVVKTSSPTATYRWGDGEYEMHHCACCGCTTHYTATELCLKSGLGINLRMLDRTQMEQIPIVG